MSKSKFIQHKFLSKTNIGLVCVLIAVFGFLFSRAFLSFGVFAFGVNALRDIPPRRWIKNKWWLLAVLWVAVYAISWFWTEDETYWRERFDVKLPILLLPLAFSFMPSFTVKQLRIFTVVTSLLLLVNVSYSIYFFALNTWHYIREYALSHVMPALAESDHIRVSLFVAVFVIWCVYFWKYLSGKAIKVFMAVVLVIFVVYLHILAARTGLLALYIFVIAYAIYLGVSKSRLLGAGILVVMFGLGFLAYNYSPTLTKKIDYFRFTWEEYHRSGLLGNYSDMGRIISYDIALKKIAENPLIGVGSGDVQGEMDKGYEEMYPAVTEDRRLIPHNQFLIVAMACGIPVAMVFILWITMALSGLKANRSGFFFFIVWLVLLIPLMVEPMLEVQFGVFVYLFFLLWQRHTMLHEPVKKD